MKKHKKNNRSIYGVLSYIICCVIVYSCTSGKLYCNQENAIECTADLRKKSRDDKYTILILSYDSKFNLDDLSFYKDSILITKRMVEGDYDNPQNNPKRVTIELRKGEVSKFTVMLRKTCYELILKKTFDNYIIDFDLNKRSFNAVANNEEYLTFE